MQVTRRATAADIDRAAMVLGAAFADYPWTRWTVDSRDHGRRVTELQRLALARYGLPSGEVWVTEVDGLLECVAVWMDSAVEVGVGDFVRVATARLEGRCHARAIAAEKEIEDWRPAERHWHLATVGTSPARQRQGLASATLKPLLRKADAHGVDAFLETSSHANVAFYATLGFAAVEHRVIEGGGPDVWAMRRKPAPPTH